MQYSLITDIIDYIKRDLIKAIPKEILSVKRPTNTVVYEYGKEDGINGVKKRVGWKNGRSILVNGKTVGHIIGGKFVPVERKTLSSSGFEIRDYANVAFLDRLL